MAEEGSSAVGSTCFEEIGKLTGTSAFWGCSGKKEPGPEKGDIKKMTEKTAKEAVNRIHTPIDRG